MRLRIVICGQAAAAHARYDDWEIGVQETRSLSLSLSLSLASCLVYPPDKIRSGRYARRLFGEMQSGWITRKWEEQFYRSGTKIPIQLHQFDAMKFILAQLILAWNWPHISLIVGSPYRKERRDFYVEYKLYLTRECFSGNLQRNFN